MAEYQEQPSTIAAYSRSIAVALEQVGKDPSVVFERCKLPMPSTTDPMRRLTNREVGLLFREAVKLTGDKAFGLVVGESMHPGNLHAMGYALMASTTLRGFADRLINYYRIVSQSAHIRVEESAGEFHLITSTLAPDICWETQDAYSSLIVRFIRIILGPSFNPKRVQLMRPHPGETESRYRDFFRCDICYGCEELILTIDGDVVDKPLPGACKELAQLHDQTVMRYLERLDKSDIVNRVKTIIVDELASGTMTKQHVADKIFMGPRSLQKKLAAKGTSFQEILDSTRQSLAISYMEQSTISITETAYLLGFSNVSNFTRAFKRWTGKSPREFRLSLVEEN